jgi:hypothetical protein
MSNPIKYSTGTESLALKKGNFYIGTGAVGKGPTSETGYYNGITPPTGGYTIYLNKESNGPSIYTASNDAQLISLTNSIAGQSYTGVQQCFNYFYGQTDKLLVNQDYPADYPYIVMDGLVLNLDAGITQSYLGSGTTWTDVNGLGPKNNGTLTNGPTFNSGNGGSIVFDGVDDYVDLGSNSLINTNLEFTIDFWVNMTTMPSSITAPITVKSNSVDLIILISSRSSYEGITIGAGSVWSPGKTNTSSNFFINNWVNVVITYNGNGSETLGNFNVYENNTNKTLNIGVGGLISSSTTTKIGFINSGNQLDGKIATFKVYNKKLSQTEITQNYNAQKGRFGL